MTENYAVRLFLNDERVKSNEIPSQEDARIFKHAAEHLIDYLNKEYLYKEKKQEEKDEV